MIYDNVIMRTIIDLPEDQVRELESLCKAERISRAEAVRRALAQMLSQKQSTGRENAFGVWKNKKIDGRKFVEKLRREWD
jgi:metal-responsive CopG/Arc/MetJ family transcriptional regulator